MASFAASGGSGARSYGTIVADPPWIYGSDAYANNPKPGEVRTKAIRKPLPYPEMTLAQIRALPVSSMAATDCRLWMWTTNRYLPAAFGVMEAWGFEYRQTIVWHKTGNPSPFGGSVAPNHAEYILVGVRGNPETRSRLKSNVVAANVTGTSATATVSIYTNGAVAQGSAPSGGTAYPIIFQVPVPANASVVVVDKSTAFYLGEAQSIVVTVGTASAIELTSSFEAIT